jgi:hypothetical protein
LEAGSNTPTVALLVVGSNEGEDSDLRQKIMVTSSAGLEQKNDCAGEVQQQL